MNRMHRLLPLLISAFLSTTRACDTTQATDTYGDGCEYYTSYPHACGDFDDEDFTANTMCCACQCSNGLFSVDGEDCVCKMPTDGIHTYQDLELFSECVAFQAPIKIYDCSDCVDLRPLSNVVTVGCIYSTLPAIEISFNNNLKTLRGLEGIQGTLCGNLVVSANAQLQNLDALENILEVRGHIDIMQNTMLESLHGLRSVDRVTKDLTITDNCALLSLEGMRGLEYLHGGTEIMRNPNLRSLAGLRNMKVISGIANIHGTAVESIEGVGRSLVQGGNWNVDLTASSNMCVSGARTQAQDAFFFQDPGVSLPQDLWSTERCTSCSPICPITDDITCDMTGGGMCACDAGFGGPDCTVLPEVYFDSSAGSIFFDVVEPIEGSRLDTFEFPIGRSSGRVHDTPTPVRAFAGDYSTISTLTWGRSSDSDGVLKVILEISRDEARSNVENVRIELRTDNSIAYPDLRVRDGSVAIVRIHPFGGYFEFSAPIVATQEGLLDNSASDESLSSCLLWIRRVGGSAGHASVDIAYTNRTSAEEDDVCSAVTQSYSPADSIVDFRVLSTTYAWVDGDDAPQCVRFTIVDDDEVETLEAACLRLVRPMGSAELSPSGDTGVVLTINDNDASSDDTTTVVLSVVSVMLVVFVALGTVAYRVRRHRERASYSILQLKLEDGCTETEALTLMNDLFANVALRKVQKPSSAKSFVRRISTAVPSTDPEKDSVAIKGGTAASFSACFHYLVSQDDKPNHLDILRLFLSEHREVVPMLASIPDKSDRPALNVACGKARALMEAYLLLCGRYRVHDGPVVHRSRTCEVVFAVDEKDRFLDAESHTTKGRLVALKMMKDREQFEREIRTRSKYSVDSCVVRVLGWHASSSNFAFEGDRRSNRLRRSELAPPGEYRYILVLERGDFSAFQALSSCRVAGHDVESVSRLATGIARCLYGLHSCKLVHNDIKLRNILVSTSGMGRNKADASRKEVVLCDLDACVATDSMRSCTAKQGSSGYFSPEVARWNVRKSANEDDATLCQTASLDVWSFGVVLFELCAGQNLFPIDLNDDSMVEKGDVTKLCVWSCISDTLLLSIFKGSTSCSATKRLEAMHLVRWCLQGDPTKRPTARQILRHPFLRCLSASIDRSPSLDRAVSSTLAMPERLTKSYSTNPKANVVSSLASLPEMPQRHHFFISHMQAEASGDVGTLYHYFASMGMSCWRDMTLKGEITEDAMRNGVKSSDIVIVFLTNSSLSRPFCQKEMLWALEFAIPMIFVVETEERFWSWNIDRWRQDRCSKGANSTWTKGWLSRTFEQCPKAIKDVVEHHQKNDLMLPFRRRQFELDALMRQILKRVAKLKRVRWGDTIPPNPLLLKARRAFVGSVSYLTDSSSDAIRTEVFRTLTRTLECVAPKVNSVQSHDVADLVIVVLSRGVLNDARALKALCDMSSLKESEELGSTRHVFVYLGDGEDAWDWSIPWSIDMNGDTAKRERLAKFICGHEAYLWRHHEYETRAMVEDIVLHALVVKTGRIFASIDSYHDAESSKEQGTDGDSTSPRDMPSRICEEADANDEQGLEGAVKVVPTDAKKPAQSTLTSLLGFDAKKATSKVAPAP